MEVPAPAHFLHLKLPRSVTFHSSTSDSEISQVIKRTISNDKLFKLKSLDTGEEIDLRDENDTSFVPKLAKMLTLGHGYALSLQSYLYLSHSEQRRTADHKLWEAAERGDLEGCQEALTIAQTNSKGLNEWTALHLAAHQGHVSVVLMLLHPSYGTDVNSLTSLGRTPLHLAAINGTPEIIECLIAHGCNLDAQDKEGWTALHHAANMGHMPALNLIMKAGADDGVANGVGKTAYDLAANAEVANLLSQGATKYTRTLFNGVLMRNSREDKITSLLRHSTEYKRETTEATDTTNSSSPIEHRITPSDFQLICQLGRGSFGEVYFCKLGPEELALKVLNKAQVLSKTVIRYTKTEREVLAMIRHPFIIELKAAFQTPEKLILALEYCSGGDLGYHLSREKRFSEDRARIYICEVLLAIEELHANNIIYRDLKPDNIVLDAEGHVKLTDFGLAKIVKNDQAKSFCGSVAYLAPELIKRQPYTLAVDWYLLGVLLYELLVGIPPFFSCNKDLLFENIQKAKLKFPKFVSEAAQNFISRLMDRDPKTRLGANGPEEVKEHVFFAGVDWRAVLNRKLRTVPVARIPRKPETLPPEHVFGNMSKPDQNFVEDWTFNS